MNCAGYYEIGWHGPLLSIVTAAIEPYFPKSLRKDLLEHPTVEGLVTLCVVVNLGMMGAESYKRTQAQTDVEKISEYFFSWLFGIEVTLKIWCMTTSMFRYNRFNMLEWCVSSLSAISLFIPCMYAPIYETV